MTWNTANVLAVFLDCDIWVHHQYFFGNIHSFPVISPMGTSQSHDLEHCECTVHVPAGVITGKLSGKFKMYLQCSRWVHCWCTVHFLVMYLQCSWWEHHHLPPVRVACLDERCQDSQISKPETPYFPKPPRPYPSLFFAILHDLSQFFAVPRYEDHKPHKPS